MTIFALHGFLGLPQDWEQFPIFQSIDIFAFSDPEVGLWNFARTFNAHIARISNAPRHILGYSMGARLAMHALLDQPSLWTSAIFVSGHPGLKGEVEKKAKMKQDTLWAQRFLKDPWEQVMQQWEAQPVFDSSRVLPRFERDYNKPLLAATLKGFSLGLQDDLSERLEISIPQLWVAGFHDRKYEAIVREKKNHWIAPNAGHRVPWDCPKEFQKHVLSFTKEIEDASAAAYLGRNQNLSRYQIP